MGMEQKQPSRQVPMGVVIARILTVSGIGLSASIGIILLVAGAWQIGLAVLALAALFILLMFVIERG